MGHLPRVVHTCWHRPVSPDARLFAPRCAQWIPQRRLFGLVLVLWLCQRIVFHRLLAQWETARVEAEHEVGAVFNTGQRALLLNTKRSLLHTAKDAYDEVAEPLEPVSTAHPVLSRVFFPPIFLGGGRGDRPLVARRPAWCAVPMRLDSPGGGWICTVGRPVHARFFLGAVHCGLCRVLHPGDRDGDHRMSDADVAAPQRRVYGNFDVMLVHVARVHFSCASRPCAIPHMSCRPCQHAPC